MLKRIYLLTLLFTISCNILNAQQSPLYDSNWILNIQKSDEFNSQEIDTNKWEIINDFQYYTGWTNGYFHPANSFIVGDSILRLSASSRNLTGGIMSKKEEYLYGYYEVKCKLPGFFDYEESHPSNFGLWTAFWVYHQVRDTNSSNPRNIIEHCEVDIIEPSGLGEEADARTNNMGHHCPQDTLSEAAKKISEFIIHDLPILYEDYHKFGASILPNKIRFFFDDELVAETTTQPIPDHNMTVVMGNQLRPDSVLKDYTPFPLFFDIDYFRFYKLNASNCDQDIQILTSRDLLNFGFGIWKNITIGSTSSSNPITISHSTSSFLASESVTLNNISILSGLDFEIDIVDCETLNNE